MPDWERPTGGLVMPTPDVGYAYAIACERYHYGPHERLWVKEVGEVHDRAMAAMLHKRWEREMNKWMETVS